MLILKQNAANTVPTPPAGKGTIFLDDSDTLSVKTSDGNVETFPTVAASNAQVVFMNGTSLSGEAALTYDFNNNVLNVSGNVAAGNVKTDNLLYANGTAWDLSDPGGSNTQIQFNDDESFGGSAAFTFDKSSNLVTVGANLNANNINVTTHITSGNVWANSGIISAQTLKGEGGNISNIQGANVSGAVATATNAGTVTTAAQPNITSVGNLTALVMAGNVTPSTDDTYDLGNNTHRFKDIWLSGNSIRLGGAIIRANATSVIITNPQGGNTSFTGSTTSNNSSIVNGTSNVVAEASGNVTTSVNGTANVFVVTATGANITGTLNATGNANLNNLGTAQVLASANVTAPQFVSNVSTGTAPFVVASQTKVTNLNADLLDGMTTNTLNTGLTIVNRDADGSFAANIVTATLSGAATTAGTVTTNAQPNITSVGTLTSLTVSGNASAGNLNTAGTVVASTLESNVSTGTAPFVVVSTTRVANLDVAKAGVANTVNDASQPNITSVGTLTSLAVTGNATAGNVYANAGTIGASLLTGTLTTASQPNITSVGTLSSLTTTGNVAAGNLTTTGVLSVTGTGVSSIAGNLDMTSNTIINLAAPTNPSDAATKQYVDDIAQGLHVHAPCSAATPDTLANISGGTITYNNGSSGVGANLVTTGSYATIDGVNIATVGTRILVKNEANAAHNGIYEYTSSTVLTRTTDYDTPTEMAGGDFTFVQNGTLYNDTGWVMTDPVTTVGTSPVTFVQFSGAGTYTAGTGLTLTGTVFSVNASQTQVTSVGTLGTLSVTGNANVGNIGAAAGVFTTVSGNGALLTDLNASNVSSGTLAQARLANASVTLGSTALTLGSTVTTVAGLTSVTSTTFVGALTGAATTAGTVTTNAQPNITSVGTLTSLSVTGNANVGNIGAAAGVFTSVSGNGALLTDLNASNISSGTLAQARLANSSLTINGSSVSLGGTVTVTATATNALTLGSYLTGTSYNGSTAVTAAVDATSANTASKVVARDASGNFSAGTITATLSGAATTAGTVTTAAQPNITSVGTLTGLTVSATISGSVSGSAATVTTAAQPNITSVGTLTGLTVSGATTISSNSALTTTNLTTGANTTAGYITGNWTLTTGSKLQATYADLAEKYTADANYGPGTVLLFGGDHEVTISNVNDSHCVAGVVSTNPAYVMNSGCQGEHVVDLALQGRVPVKVHGPVAKGDLMVSGPNGHAVANNMARAGTIIGKALQNFSGDHGVIEVVIGRV